jgi:hypothetical protein
VFQPSSPHFKRVTFAFYENFPPMKLNNSFFLNIVIIPPFRVDFLHEKSWMKLKRQRHYRKGKLQKRRRARTKRPLDVASHLSAARELKSRVHYAKHTRHPPSGGRFAFHFAFFASSLCFSFVFRSTVPMCQNFQSSI